VEVPGSVPKAMPRRQGQFPASKTRRSRIRSSTLRGRLRAGPTRYNGASHRRTPHGTLSAGSRHTSSFQHITLASPIRSEGNTNALSSICGTRGNDGQATNVHCRQRSGRSLWFESHGSPHRLASTRRSQPVNQRATAMLEVHGMWGAHLRRQPNSQGRRGHSVRVHTRGPQGPSGRSSQVRAPCSKALMHLPRTAVDGSEFTRQTTGGSPLRSHLGDGRREVGARPDSWCPCNAVRTCRAASGRRSLWICRDAGSRDSCTGSTRVSRAGL
jgi:hypothetical protein